MNEHPSAPAFTRLTDLAAERFGGRVLACSDDFFAEKENLLKPGRGVFIPDKYTERGKWMDGWESRRKRNEGHDWCILRLGTAGVLQGVDIDTNHFLGNHPPFASLEACYLPVDDGTIDWEKEAALRWTEILPKSPLQPGSQNFFALENRSAWTHLRLNIYPDGGVARLKVYGDVVKDWSTAPAGELIDLGAAVNGARALACNDEFFSRKENINMPGRGVDMGDGWETRRSRTPGHCDWLVVQLARKGRLQKIVIDTAHFKGNYPDRCRLDGCLLPAEVTSFEAADWKPILPEQRLSADHEHVFEAEILPHEPVTHVRLTIVPDGGVSRLRLFGTPDPESISLAELNAVSDAVFSEKLARCCGARAWVDRMRAARPFRTVAELLEDASTAWFACRKADWLEAFTRHPRIGDVDSLKRKFASTAAWAGNEQAAVRAADETLLQELKTWNDRYFEKFGFIFIVFATGKSAAEMLALLKQRYENELVEEILNAVLEQDKITRLRLRKLIL